MEVAEDIGMAGEDYGMGGQQLMGLGDVLQGGGAGGSFICVWYLSADPRMGQALGKFQHRFTRCITGRNPKRREGGGWEYPPLETEMEEAEFEDMVAYVLKRNNTVAQYIATQQILYLRKNTVGRTG